MNGWKKHSIFLSLENKQNLMLMDKPEKQWKWNKSYTGNETSLQDHIHMLNIKRIGRWEYTFMTDSSWVGRGGEMVLSWCFKLTLLSTIVVGGPSFSVLFVLVNE